MKRYQGPHRGREAALLNAQGPIIMAADAFGSLFAKSCRLRVALSNEAGAGSRSAAPTVRSAAAQSGNAASVRFSLQRLRHASDLTGKASGARDLFVKTARSLCLVPIGCLVMGIGGEFDPNAIAGARESRENRPGTGPRCEPGAGSLA